jgi:formiminoglutamase
VTSEDPASGRRRTNDGPIGDPPEWTGPSDDPNDEQFGDVVESAALDNVADYDVIIAGEPYDGAVIGRRGAAEGPGAIRKSLAATKTHHVDLGPIAVADGSAGDRENGAGTGEKRGRDSARERSRDPEGRSLGIADLGDVRLPAVDGGPASEGNSTTDSEAHPVDDRDREPSVEAVQERVRSAASELYGRGAVPVFLGGDNSLTYANVAPLLERGSVGVLSFDAHLDCRQVRAGVGPTSGTPYRQLHDEGLDALAVLGARHFETSTAYHDYLHDQGGRAYTPAEVTADPVDAADEAIASLGDVDAIYVSVDVDVLDSAAAPGVSAPTPGGLSTRELYRLLDHVATRGRVAGFEVVECAPPLDRDDLTVDAAARAVAHFLASLAAPTGRHSRRGALDG